MKLDKTRVLKIIRSALKEDIGSGDITTNKLISKWESIRASIVTNEDCVLCGINVAEWVINTLDYSVRFKPQAMDGQRLCAGKTLAFLEGHARAILTAERTMLNFLSFLSGISTYVNQFVEKVKKYGVEIYDTRKTLPLLRYLEKYAVRIGGGHNHRYGLWDQVLVKENHIVICKNFFHKMKEFRKKIPADLKIEIEVENIRQFKMALEQGPDIIMLDKMNPHEVQEAIRLRGRISKKPVTPILEVSGMVNMENIEEYAKTGVERISIGSITDSVNSVDMSLNITG